MWVYGGIFPGPTIEVNSYQKVHVQIINNLPINKPLLPQSDLGMTRMYLLYMLDLFIFADPQDRIVVHLHGGISKPQYL